MPDSGASKMNSEERVLTAFRFQRPDKIPVMGDFWSFPPEWEARFGDPGLLTDTRLYVPVEGAFSLNARLLKEEGGWNYTRDNWGRLVRNRGDAYFSETMESPLEGSVDLKSVVFDSPFLDSRYLRFYRLLQF